MVVYGIGGLGVNEEIFSHLDLNFEIIPLKWIKPFRDEPLSQYALRFSETIDRKRPFILIGVSFGGILAIELNKILNPRQTILISSAADKSDIPYFFRLFGKIGAIDLIPDTFLKPPPFLAHWFFGISGSSHKQLLNTMIKNTDLDFLRWAINRITKWDSLGVPPGITRIHGSSDRLLKCPIKGTKNSLIIPDAGHFMIVDRAKTISQVLDKEY